jgi:predicted alpha/beta-hydrolase family hydrolase
MGARVAAEIASTLDQKNKSFIIGVLCLSYPLHPPQKTTEQRLSSILPLRIPVLFLSGTKDPMCHQELMENTLKRLNCDWTIHWVQGGDHSLLLKGKDLETNQTYKDILQDLCDTVLLWTQSVFMGER